MIQEITFSKASGAGNDFIIVDNREQRLPVDKRVFAQRLCSRHFGVGGDGLLLLERSPRAHFRMEYYNADGSDGGMCGNGGRCIARYAFDNGIAPKEMSFEALDFLYRASILSDRVSLTMKDPSDIREDFVVHLDQEVHRGFFVNTGSPHFVEFVEDVESVNLDRLGRAIRHDPSFSPDGTNVNFAEIIDDHSLRLRTYERGVEAETLACGTGSVAAGILAHLFHEMAFPISICVRSGEFLTVSATSDHNLVRAPRLDGSAHILFAGSLLYDHSESRILDFKKTKKPHS